MKIFTNKKLVCLLLVCSFLSFPIMVAQIRVVDNKGTVSTVHIHWNRVAGTTKDIHNTDLGNVGIGINKPNATFHNAGSTILGLTSASDVAANYTVPTAFVDNYSGMVIAQKTIPTTITLSEPTNKYSGRLFTIINSTESSFPLTISGAVYTITPSKSVQFVWNGVTWSLPGTFDISALPVMGDITGTLSTSNLAKLQGKTLSIGSVSAGDMLRYDGTNWANWVPDFLKLSSLSATAPLNYNSTTGAFTIAQANTTTNGYLSFADWNTFNNKQATISLTTTGASGNATFSDNKLNIPNYTYTLPAATTTTLGGVIAGSGLSVTAGGTISTVNNGTLTNFSASDLSPLFTTSEATTTTTPALSFGLMNAGANTVFGNNTGASAAPSYFSATALPVDGDVAGTLGTSSVNKLKGIALEISILASGNILRYDGTSWTNWTPDFLKLSSLSATTPLSYNNTTGAFTIAQANTTTNGYLSSADWTKFNDKVSSVAAGSSKVSIGGTATAPSVDVNTANLGTIGLAVGTTGTTVNVSGSPANLGGTLTLNIPMASAIGVTAGLMSKADYDAFAAKQATISLTTTGTTGNATFSGNTLNIPNYTYTLPTATATTLGGVIAGSGLNVTAGGTISTVNNGTLTNFSAADLSPLFTTSEATTTTTPALSFSLTNAGANTIFGNNTGTSAAPSYFSATALPVAGDVSGTLGASNVNKLKGISLAINSLTLGNLLRYDGTNWTNWTPNFLTLSAFSATAPLSYNNTTGVFEIAKATTSINGYLSAADWNTFNNKVSFPGFGLTTAKVWGYDSHPTTIAGYGITDAAPVSGSTNYIQNQNSAAQSANIWISGTVTAPTGVFTNVTVNGILTAPSDIRLKTKIETLTNVLAKLEQLRGVSYEYTDQQKYAKGPQVGVIAQELQKVFPELVKTDDKGYLSVNYTQLTGVLIQAIKEQQSEIELLKTQMEKVMSKLGMK